MRHDYDLPPDYEKRIEEGTIDRWYKQERARRQAESQDTNWSEKVKKASKRLERKVGARNETTDVER